MVSGTVTRENCRKNRDRTWVRVVALLRQTFKEKTGREPHQPQPACGRCQGLWRSSKSDATAGVREVSKIMPASWCYPLLYSAVILVCAAELYERLLCLIKGWQSPSSSKCFYLRMNKVLVFIRHTDTMTGSSWVYITSVQALWDKAGRLFPYSLGAEG